MMRVAAARPPTTPPSPSAACVVCPRTCTGPCVCRVTATKMIADPTATVAKPAPPTPPWPSRPTAAAARLSSLIALLVLLVLLLDVGAASASICKAGLCTREQYCCGDGKCCDNVYSLWYLCGGVAVMLFVVGSFCPVIRQCCCFRTPVIVKYVPVPTSPTKFKYSDSDKCTRVDVTLPLPPQATTLDITNCI
ncbi:uncharacterized protein LOC112686347 [Sipha flava]|uniref:Uncharacterized protein LOC112686347 n=1 Tax=Sipha flava TaxID=143950 RepID=A0A2S2QXK5_9HEMI|nr:uncharacterized protein LOC112686347 [Sipha flava]